MKVLAAIGGIIVVLAAAKELFQPANQMPGQGAGMTGGTAGSLPNPVTYTSNTKPPIISGTNWLTGSAYGFQP